jgi:hypothetical protein
MWRLCPTHSQCVRQRQRSAKSAAVTVTTVGGHVGTVAGALPTIEPARGVASGR